ncbi:MAG: hypothetical protein J0L92_22230 [Deltaproteobacteria bacterium]|nr:hypothetical protein [Deltaproteobacteria bacterium]
MKHQFSTFCVALTCVLVLFVACGTTPGEPATASLRLSPSVREHTTASGWDVVLDEAVIVLGAMYIYPPPGERMAHLGAYLGPSVAHAHGGFDPFGTVPVRLEWLGPASLDLLAGDVTTLGEMDGSVGPSMAATIAFEPLAGELAEPSGPGHGHHAWVAGTATRTVMGETETLEFEGGLDIGTGGTENLIEAIPSPATVGARGVWELRVDVAGWLDQARFERLAGDGTRVIAPGTQPAIAWNLGLRDPTRFVLAYTPAAGE